MSHNYPYRQPTSDTDLRPDPGQYRSSDQRHSSADRDFYRQPLEPFPAASSYSSVSSSRGSAALQSSPEGVLSILSSCGLEPSDLALLAELPEDVLTIESLPHILRQIKCKRGNINPFSPRAPSPPPSSSTYPLSSTLRPVPSATSSPRDWDQLHHPPIQFPLDRLPPSALPKEQLLDRWGNPMTVGSLRVNPPPSSSLSSSGYPVDFHRRQGSSDYGKTGPLPSFSPVRQGERDLPARFSEAGPADYRTAAAPPLLTKSPPKTRVGRRDSSSMRSTCSSASMPSKKEAQDFHGISPLVFPYSCSLCDITVLSERVWLQHVSGTQHADGQLSLLQQFPDWDCRMETVRRDDNKSQKRRNDGGKSSSTTNETASQSTRKSNKKTLEKGKVVCVKFPPQSVDEAYLRKLSEPFGKIVKILMFPSLGFVELGSVDQAKDLVKFHSNYPPTVNGEQIEFSISNAFNFLQSSRVVSFSPAPLGEDGKLDLISIVKRFGPPLYTLFLPSVTFVEMKNAPDAQKLVDYYQSNSLRLNNESISVSFSGEYKTLMRVSSAKRYEEESSTNKRTGSLSRHKDRTTDNKRVKRGRTQENKSKDKSSNEKQTRTKYSSRSRERSSRKVQTRSKSQEKLNRKRKSRTRSRSKDKSGSEKRTRTRSESRSRDKTREKSNKDQKTGSQENKRRSRSRSKDKSKEKSNKDQKTRSRSRDKSSRDQKSGSKERSTCRSSKKDGEKTVDSEKPRTESTPKDEPAPSGDSKPEASGQEHDKAAVLGEEIKIEGMEVLAEDGEKLEDKNVEALAEGKEEAAEKNKSSAEGAPENKGAPENDKEEEVKVREPDEEKVVTDEEMKKEEEESKEGEETCFQEDEEELDFPVDLENCITLDELEENESDNQEESLDRPESPPTSTRVLYFRNLPPHFTLFDLFKVLKTFGRVVRYRLVRNQLEGFIEMSSSAVAKRAVKQLSKKPAAYNCPKIFLRISSRYYRLPNGWDVHSDGSDNEKNQSKGKGSEKQSKSGVSDQDKTDRRSKGQKEPPNKMSEKKKKEKKESLSTRTSGKESVSKKPSEKESTSKKTSENESTSKKPSEKESTSKKTPEKESTSKKPSEKESTSKKPSEKESTSKKPSEKESTSKKTPEKESTSKKPSEKESTSKKTPEKESTSKKPSEKASTSKKPSEKESTSKKPSEKESTSRKASEEESASRKTSEEESVSKKMSKGESSHEKTTGKALNNSLEKESADRKPPEKGSLSDEIPENVTLKREGTSEDNLQSQRTMKTETEEETQRNEEPAAGGQPRGPAEEDMKPAVCLKVESDVMDSESLGPPASSGELSLITKQEPQSGPGESATEPHKPTKPVGTEFVRPVVGYFCNLCQLIFADEDEAKQQHCSSPTHYSKYQEKTGTDPWMS